MKFFRRSSSPPIPAPPPRWHDGLILAQALGLALLALSYVRIAGDSQSMLFRTRVFDAMFAGSIWGTALAYNLMLFAASVLLVHVVYATCCWALGHVSLRAWPSLKAPLKQHIILWFLILTVGLLANNAAGFVESSLGAPYADAMGMEVLGMQVGRALWLVALFSAGFTALVAAARWWRAGGRPDKRSWLTIGAIGVACVAVSGLSIHTGPASASEPDKPNVILIGLDSLREDLLNNPAAPAVTPNVQAFMHGGVQFTNAITPLARTFPSMMSMLTGRHPHRSGAVMNLLPRDVIHDEESLPRILARAGYHTAYATDEVRFSNIDSSFGFAQTITPPIGSSEFLISQLSDTPLINQLMNTRVGGWLFPIVHANRGSSVNYDPDEFVHRIDSELTVRQPLLLIVHLTLSHWPYTWASSPVKSRDPEATWPEYYQQAIGRTDQQFADVLGVLETKGLLRNAIVVAYSDHGEGFESPHEALVADDDPLIHALHLEPTWGHGTTVLTAHQYRIVLGMRRFGAAKDAWNPGRKSAAAVTFEDVTPTLVDALAVPHRAQFDGRSLLPLLESHAGAEQAFSGRIRFTETEFQAKGIATQDGKVSGSSVEDALVMYRVDPVTDRIEVKRSKFGRLLLDRQYAAIGKTHLVAAFPNAGGTAQDYLAVPLNGGPPQQLFADTVSPEPEVAPLLSALLSEFSEVLQAPPQPPAPQTVADRVRTIPPSVNK